MIYLLLIFIAADIALAVALCVRVARARRRRRMEEIAIHLTRFAVLCERGITDRRMNATECAEVMLEAFRRLDKLTTELVHQTTYRGILMRDAIEKSIYRAARDELDSAPALVEYAESLGIERNTGETSHAFLCRCIRLASNWLDERGRLSDESMRYNHELEQAERRGVE